MIGIEPYQNSYKQPVIDLILTIQQKEFGIPIQLSDQPDLEDIETNYCYGNGGFWVAIKRNQVIGSIGLIDIGFQEFALRKMFVKEEFRGKEYSVALNLVNHILQWCRQKNGKSIYLGTIDKFKAAHRFYEKNGFIQIITSQLPSSFPRMTLDAIFYKYSLNER